MTNPFKEPHYSIFAGVPFKKQGAFGKAPSQWFKDLGFQAIPDQYRLPDSPLDRKAVREICRNPNIHVLVGYVCVMAWGFQEKGPRGARGARDPWEQRDKTTEHLKKLRAGGLSRVQAYNLFRNEGSIKGLGPSYFSKLLFFFSPAEDYYIMDQWTSKSINLLRGEMIVRLSSGSPVKQNKGGNYQAYCEEIDSLAKLLGTSGDEIEQRLMSKGKPNPGPWRKYLLGHVGYNKERIQKMYPHISPRDL